LILKVDFLIIFKTIRTINFRNLQYYRDNDHDNDSDEEMAVVRPLTSGRGRKKKTDGTTVSLKLLTVNLSL
jgi:hypothetical protein